MCKSGENPGTVSIAENAPIRHTGLMEALGKWDLEHWWKLLAAAGALIASTSAPVIFVPGVLIGLGPLFFGIGEWINHPIQMRRTGGVITESHS